MLDAKAPFESSNGALYVSECTSQQKLDTNFKILITDFSSFLTNHFAILFCCKVVCI